MHSFLATIMTVLNTIPETKQCSHHVLCICYCVLETNSLCCSAIAAARAAQEGEEDCSWSREETCRGRAKGIQPIPDHKPAYACDGILLMVPMWDRALPLSYN